MTSRLTRLIPLMLVLGLVAAACGDGESEPVTLSLGYPFPADHPLRVQVLEPWAEDLRAATDGSVTIEFHAEQALSPAGETYANVVAGGQDIGWGVQGYSPGRFPATDVIEMPFVFSSGAKGTKVLRTLYDDFEALRDEYADVKVLGLWATTPGDLWLAKGTASTPADVAGLTLRSPGPAQAAVIRALGATPVNMAAPDLRGALEAGEIDGVLTVAAVLEAHSLLDVLESGTVCRCYVVASFLVMNLDTWDSLSQEQQAAVEELSGEKLSQAAAKFYDEGNAAAAGVNAAAGIINVQLDDAQLDQWREATSSVVDDWINDNSGAFDAAAMHQRMLELAGAE